MFINTALLDILGLILNLIVGYTIGFLLPAIIG